MSEACSFAVLTVYFSHMTGVITLAASVCPPVCLVGKHRLLTMTHQEAACDAAIVHFGPTTRRNDIVVNSATVKVC